MEYFAPESNFAELCKNSWALWEPPDQQEVETMGQETDRGQITHKAQIERLVNIVIVGEIEWKAVFIVVGAMG